MENILKNLKDVSWWFSVVFVGLLISLFAPWLSRGVMRLLSYFSTAMKRRKEESERRIEKKIDLISSDPHRIVIQFILVGIVFQGVGISMLFGFVSLVGYLIAVYMKTHPMLKGMFAGGGFSSLVFAMVLTSFCSRNGDIAWRAYRKYRKRVKEEDGKKD